MNALASGRGLHNVPAELTSFVGRRRELEEIRRQLGRSRLVTLTGTGGVGKTRLAGRSAAELQRVYPDGVWLVELAGLQDPALVSQAVAGALGLRDHSAEWVVATLSAYLASRELLLVLDNCEHLLNACAVLSGALLAASPKLRILATSREPLGISGEVTIPVSPLSLPAGNGYADAHHASASEAVALFAERGAAVRPGFGVTAENEAALSQLCRRLDGIPLAIELAAVRLRALSVDEILSRIDNRLDLLIGGSRTALPRHQTLRAAIDWSHDSLDGPSQALFRRLSVFAGGFDLSAVETVCGSAPVPSARIVDLLTGLIEKSLIVRGGDGRESRFQMLETIREYAGERLEAAGEEPAVRGRHRAWISEVARRAQSAWWSSKQVEWLNRLEADHANLRGALEFCLSTDDAASGMEIASSLWLYWQARGHLTEGRRWLSSLLEHDCPERAARARALGAAGNLALMQGDVSGAMDLLAASRDEAKSGNESGSVAFAVQYLGLASIFRGDLDVAVGQLKEALSLYEVQGNGLGIANTLGMLARALSNRGDSVGAVKRWEQSIPMSEAVGDRWALSYTLWNLGVELWLQGRYHEAVEREKAGLRLKRELDERLGIALCLEALAWFAASAAHFERAAILLGASGAVWETLAATLFDAFQPYHDACETAARSQLGEKRFLDQVYAGKALAMDEAVAYALEESAATQPIPLQTRLSVKTKPVLTKREREIASLVAEGLSNKQIAARLVVSERTAEYHILNILNKLGFNSRTQIASWATESLSR